MHYEDLCTVRIRKRTKTLVGYQPNPMRYDNLCITTICIMRISTVYNIPISLMCLLTFPLPFIPPQRLLFNSAAIILYSTVHLHMTIPGPLCIVVGLRTAFSGNSIYSSTQTWLDDIFSLKTITRLSWREVNHVGHGGVSDIR